MTNPVPLSQLIRQANDEAQVVRHRRTNLLAARGLLEMLIQKAILAQGRLARGRYHLTFKSDIPSKGVLAPIARAEMIEATDALQEVIPVVFEAMELMSSLDVATCVTTTGLALIAAELDDCQRRVRSAEEILRDWRRTNP